MIPDAEAIVADSVRRLFPSLSKNDAFASLLLEHARRNLIKYQSQARRYESKYGQPFAEFRQLIIEGSPDSELEQDYFDWELAITGADDMKLEINRLGPLLDQ